MNPLDRCPACREPCAPEHRYRSRTGAEVCFACSLRREHATDVGEELAPPPYEPPHEGQGEGWCNRREGSGCECGRAHRESLARGAE